MKFQFAFLSFTFLVLLLLREANASDAAKPNVIIVMTDDQGYPELSVHGNPVLNTPHLDRLHSQSLRLTDYHVSPMCTPTRGQLLTGIDAARNGAINVSSGRSLLRPELPTMGDIFSDNGYATGIFGKWHLGDNYPFRPQDRGFQESLWFPSSHIGSVPDYRGNDYFDDTYIKNGKRQQFTGYCTDIFFDEAIKFISGIHHMDIGEKPPYGFEGLTKRVEKGDTHATFTLKLNKGPIALHTWFDDSTRETIASAYYVYVTRK